MDCTVLPAFSIGSRVPRRFAQARIHSVYPHACNIELADGTLVTLLAAHAGNIPHGIRCLLPPGSNFQTWLRRGERSAADGALVRVFQSAVTIDLAAAWCWRCQINADVLDPDASGQALLSVRRVLRELAPASGFAPLVLNHTQPLLALEQATRRRLMRALPALAQAMSRLDGIGATQALRQLAGLGPGLTPAGDDFIVGYMAGMYARRAAEPRQRAFVHELSATVMEFAAQANLISRQYLLNAAAGEFSERLSQVVGALTACDVRRSEQSAARLLHIGHSSGADSLVGLLFSLNPLVVSIGALTCTNRWTVASLRV